LASIVAEADTAVLARDSETSRGSSFSAELHAGGDVDLAIKMYERALPNTPASVTKAMRQRLVAWSEETSLPQNHDAILDALDLWEVTVS
jgi:hypothetical protein